MALPLVNYSWGFPSPELPFQASYDAWMDVSLPTRVMLKVRVSGTDGVPSEKMPNISFVHAAVGGLEAGDPNMRCSTNIAIDTFAPIVYSIIQKAFFIMEHTGVKSVAKAMQLLDYVVEQTLHDRAVPLAELAGVLDCPTNSARNILKTLVDCGYLAQAGHGLYGLGAKVRQLGLLNRLEAPASRQAILVVLRDVASRTGEACVLAGLLQGERIVAAHVDSTQAIRVDHSVIEEKPFFALPTGRMLAAMADERQRKTVIDRHGLPGKHWDDIDDRDALAAALDDLRTVGCCRMIEADSGLFSLAVPVSGTAGDLPAALGAFAPTFRCTPEQQDELTETLKTAAGKLSAAMPTTRPY